MNDIYHQYMQESYIIESNGTVSAVSEAFLQLTDFYYLDLIDKPFKIVWHSLLHINSNPNSIEENQTSFLFTKSLKARCVNISIIKDANITIYLIDEIPNSRFDENNPLIEKLISDNVIGVGIYGVIDYTLIKANQTYLSFLPKPYRSKEAAYGRSINDFVNNFRGSHAEKKLINIINNNQSEYLTEVQDLAIDSEDRYRDVNILPLAENGIVKYICFMVNDVSERVDRREHQERQSAIIERQKDELESKWKQLHQILDNINEAICVYNVEGKIIFTNHKAAKSFDDKCISDPNKGVSDYRYFDEKDNELPFDALPIAKALQGEYIPSAIIKAVYKDEVIYVDCSAIPISNSNGELDFVITINRDITKDYMAKKQQFYKTKELEAIIHNICEGLAVIDKQGNYIILNHIIKDIIANNKNLDTITRVGQSIEKKQFYFDGHGNKLSLQDFPAFRVIKGEKIEKQRVIAKNDLGEMHLDFTATPIFDDNGELQFGVITCYDVTELVLKNKEIKLQQEHFKILTEYMTDALFIINPDGSYAYINKRAYDLFYKVEAIKYHGDSFVHTKYYDEDGNQFSSYDFPSSKVLRGEVIENVIVKSVQPDKTIYLSMDGKPVFHHDKIIYAVVCVRDITERYSYEQIIKQQKELLEATIENMSDAFAVYDSQGKLLLYNGEACIMYPSLKTHKTIGDAHKPFQYLDLENNIIQTENLPTRRAMKGEKVRNEKLIILRPDKAQITEINSTPIFDKEQKLVSVVTSHRDITESVIRQQELKNHQEQLLKTERERTEALEASIKVKDEFLYLITHEFRTPMAVVSSSLQAIELMYNQEISPNVRKHLNRIKQNTNRQLRLVNNLLDITRMSSGYIKINISRFDIIYVTKEIINSIILYAKQKGVAVSFTTAVESYPVYLDEEKFERIMLNLLANALKFTPRGKSIHVTLSLNKIDSRDSVLVSVKDEGIGIPKDKQTIVFEKFGQADTSLSRQAEGTGLGLHLVKLLVDALSGQITLESEPGKGSTFTVMLPVVNPVALDDEAASSIENVNQSISGDNRIIQSASIEFSDIYFD